MPNKLYSALYLISLHKAPDEFMRARTKGNRSVLPQFTLNKLTPKRKITFAALDFHLRDENATFKNEERIADPLFHTAC